MVQFSTKVCKSFKKLIINVIVSAENYIRKIKAQSKVVLFDIEKGKNGNIL